MSDGAEVDAGGALPCPLCGYDLRATPAGRCPECGHRFDPAELRAAREARQRDRADRPLPWLVEYAAAGTRTGWVSPLLTPLATSVPWWFWRTLRPHMRIRPRPLCLYGLCVTFAGLILASTAARLDLFWDGGTVYGFVLLWPAATLGLLLALRDSLRLAKIDRRHVLRCVVYGGDVVLLVLPAALLVRWAVNVGWLPRNLDYTPGLKYVLFSPYSFTDAAPLFVTALLAAVFWVRLTVAYRQYLRFRHATAAVAATQIILVLLALLLRCVAVL